MALPLVETPAAELQPGQTARLPRGLAHSRGVVLTITEVLPRRSGLVRVRGLATRGAGTIHASRLLDRADVALVLR